MTSIPVFINCRDRVSCLALQVAWLERAGHDRIYLVDNDSAWPALLEYYDQTPHTVVRLNRNVGYKAPWDAGVVARYAPDEPYVVTDPDVVPDESCPLDAVEHLSEVLNRYHVYRKVGLGLRIDDLPQHYALREDAIRWEEQNWRRPVTRDLFHTWVDTTFAVYRAGWGSGMFPALRTGPPYMARHLPWYADSAHPDEEERFYRAHGLPGVSNWNASAFASEHVPHERRAFDRLRWQIYKRRHILDLLGRPRPGPLRDPLLDAPAEPASAAGRMDER